MKKALKFTKSAGIRLLILATVLLTTAAPRAGAEFPDGMGADDILDLARSSYVNQRFQLKGKLAKGFKEKPFDLYLANGLIQFRFSKPDETFLVQMKNGGYVVAEVVGKEAVPFGDSRYGEAVRETDLTYEDIAMRFLYWPKPVLTGTEKIKGGTSWILEVENPGDNGPYQKVQLWVDQRSGALMQLVGFDAQERKVRRFLVTRVQQIEGMWMLEEMRVERYDLDTGKVDGRTYLRIADPRDKTRMFKKGGSGQ